MGYYNCRTADSVIQNVGFFCTIKPFQYNQINYSNYNQLVQIFSLFNFISLELVHLFHLAMTDMKIQNHTLFARFLIGVLPPQNNH